METEKSNITMKNDNIAAWSVVGQTEEILNRTQRDRRNDDMSGLSDVGQAEEILNRAQRDNRNNSDIIEELAQRLLDDLFKDNKSLTGNGDEFHNFAVSISKVIGENRASLEIVKKGLDIHPNDTDLLADGILYGRNCGDTELCMDYYKRLMLIDKSRWTWRAFSFSIDYLIDGPAPEDGDSPSFNDILTLVKDYQRYLPDKEDAWSSEFDLYREYNRRSEGKRALLEADKKLNYCPQCWLKLADYEHEDGNYEDALKYTRKIRKRPSSSVHVNMAYVFFLEGQCKYEELMDKNELYFEGTVEEDDVLKVYQLFRLAMTSTGLRREYKDQINALIDRIETETDVIYPPEWSR